MTASIVEMNAEKENGQYDRPFTITDEDFNENILKENGHYDSPFTIEEDDDTENSAKRPKVSLQTINRDQITKIIAKRAPESENIKNGKTAITMDQSIAELREDSCPKLSENVETYKGLKFIKMPALYEGATSRVFVFYPNMKQIANFPRLVVKIEGAAAPLSCGVCKIVPPPQWNCRPTLCKKYTDVDGFILKKIVKERITRVSKGPPGTYWKDHYEQEPMTVAEYKAVAEQDNNNNAGKTDEKIAKDCFDNMLVGQPLYGSGTEGTFFGADCEYLNPNRLGTILDNLKENEKPLKLVGVTHPELFYGMLKTSFAMHTEDMELYSINYHHYGASKFWMAVSGEQYPQCEKVLRQNFGHGYKGCKGYLMHKQTMVNPQFLMKNKIPFGTVAQHSGEFIITFPKGFHQGFNLGFNCAEAVNFASDRWIKFGVNSATCGCKGTIRQQMINMAHFMAKCLDTYYTPEVIAKYLAEQAEREPPKGKHEETEALSVLPKKVVRKSASKDKVQRKSTATSPTGNKSSNVLKRVHSESKGSSMEKIIKK